MEYITNKTESGIYRCDVFSDDYKTNHISVNFFHPLSKENASNVALLCAVLKRGNAKYGEMDKISAFLETNYGAGFSVNTAKIGDMQELSVSVNAIADEYAIDGEPISENITDLLYATLFEPMIEDGGFKASFVEQEKTNLKDRIRALINDKQSYSLEKCKEIMFEGDAYGSFELGDIECIDKITPQSLYEFYNNLINTAMLFVCYAGKKCDSDKLVLPLTKKLGNKTRIDFATKVNDSVTDVKDVKEQMKVAQSKLNLGFRLGQKAKEDIFALKMFNVIFGSSPTSKLFMNVREKLSLCYYCASVCDSAKNVMFVYSGVETKNVTVAKDEILNQLSYMKSGDFTAEEFENARAYLVDSFTQAGDMPSLAVSFLVFAIIHGHGLDPIRQIETINEVTPERVKAVAQNVTLDTVFVLEGIGGEQIDG